MEKQSKDKRKKIIVSLLVIVILILSVITIVVIKLFNKEDNNALENIVEENKVIEENIIEEPVEEDVDMPDKMGNYNVIGQLVIDKIDVKNNILDKTEDASLNLSVTKFYGRGVNDIGNLCITGHNYKNLLKRLSELEVGDTFYLINKETQSKVTYKVYNMYSCYPNEVECLDQPTEPVREVTIITCNPGGVTRLICKAREI